MQIDYAIILGAGLGTRMGQIGKKLPKPLWPIFCKKLLELQVDYCQDLGIDKIYINTHFLAKEIENFIKSESKFSNVVILHEDPLLDSGGAIHNMASQVDVNYSGNLLIVNADQFLFFENKYIVESLSMLENSRAVLFGISVDKAAKYNETVLANSVLTEIKKNSGLNDYVTYSGLGILKLDGLKPVPGISKFFETVANYKEERVQLIVPSKFEYWDFGTAEIYFESIKKIFENYKESKKGMFMTFLKMHNVLAGDVGRFYSQELNSICLEGTSNFEKDSIVGYDLVHQV